MINIIGAICLLYIFSWMFVAVDDLIDHVTNFIKYKILKKEKSKPRSYPLEDLDFVFKNSKIRELYLYIYRFFLHIKESPTDIAFSLRRFIQRGSKAIQIQMYGDLTAI